MRKWACGLFLVWYYYDDWLFPLLGKQPSLVIVLKSWHMVPTAHSGSSIGIFGVIWSQPGDILGCICSFIIFMTSLGRNTIGSAMGKSCFVFDLILRTFVAGFGWNTFLRWAANVSALVRSKFTLHHTTWQDWAASQRGGKSQSS